MKQVQLLRRFANFEAGEIASFGDERADAMVAGGVAVYVEDNQRDEPTDRKVSDRRKSKDEAGK